MTSARVFLQNIVENVLEELQLPSYTVVLERPADPAHGDYSANVALVLAKQTSSKPRELATKIVQKIQDKNHELLEKVEVAGPGFINFYLSKKYFVEILFSTQKNSEDYGKSEKGQGKTVIVEFSSPNIAKPFTIGHLRSTIIGDALANILAFSGYTVLRDNHLGDWGTQFGKQIVAIKRWGNEGNLNGSEKPVHLLVDLYVRFHAEAEKDPSLEDEARAWFVKLEHGDPEARRLWKKCIDWSMVQFNKIYRRLNVKFDMMLGESFFEDKMATVIEDFQKAGLAKESQGALLIFFHNDIYPPLMLRKKDGATLYATRDLATDKYRFQTWGKDILIINEVGAEQSLYFKQLYEAEEMAGYCKKSQRIHVGHGMFRFKEGKMSTRKGNTIWLEEVLDEVVGRAAAFNPDTAEEVGIGALKYNDLKREAIKDVIFDWDDVLNLKGNSGPYLQYTYARAQSVLRKAGFTEFDLNMTLSQEPIGLVERMIEQFPEVVERAAIDYAPHHICTYLFGLAQAFNAFYNQTKIIDSGKEESYRLLVTSAVAQVLSNGLMLLGIQAPSKM